MSTDPVDKPGSKFIASAIFRYILPASPNCLYFGRFSKALKLLNYKYLYFQITEIIG